MVLVASVVDVGNGWPTLLAVAAAPSAPLPLQLIGVIAVGFVGLALLARDDRTGDRRAAAPARRRSDGCRERDALRLGVRGRTASARRSAAVAAWLRTPAWARFPAVGPLGTVVPVARRRDRSGRRVPDAAGGDHR